MASTLYFLVYPLGGTSFSTLQTKNKKDHENKKCKLDQSVNRRVCVHVCVSGLSIYYPSDTHQIVLND